MGRIHHTRSFAAMVSIDFDFSDYPAQTQRGPRYFSGSVSVELLDHLVKADDKSGIWQIPLQRRPRWRINRFSVQKMPLNFSEDDLIAFVIGRHGCLIDTLLYAAFLRSTGFPSPNPFELMAQRALQTSDGQVSHGA